MTFDEAMNVIVAGVIAGVEEARKELKMEKTKYVALEDVEDLLSAIFADLCMTEDDMEQYWNELDKFKIHDLFSKDDVVSLLQKHYLCARETSNKDMKNHIYDMSPQDFNRELLLKSALAK